MIAFAIAKGETVPGRRLGSSGKSVSALSVLSCCPIPAPATIGKDRVPGAPTAGHAREAVAAAVREMQQ
ncbi:hypothetical protein ACFSQT_32325 [Mesorhizobium calcicola]|uniref:Uncharacterized protein n=1 Tax=Mesorhizobium calcicola TaxID=1300310 RepID=A0ABW4WM32_9HYPH